VAVLQLMLSDPSERVALQLGLLASNICAFNFPSGACGCAFWRGGLGSFWGVGVADRQGGLAVPQLNLGYASGRVVWNLSLSLPEEVCR
jgi:hypothetical protein